MRTPSNGSWYVRWGKRCLDIAGALAGLFVLLPVMAILAVLVRWRLGRPVLFRQRRPGRDGRVFDLIKFRTMTDATAPDGKLLRDAARLTRFGRFLRSTSLDELPELWNIVRGDMSFVGPRPLLVAYLGRYTPEQARRHTLRPGITGWAQVNGRNTLPWSDRLRLDVWYVDHVSLWLDLLILAMTVLRVVQRRGISQAGHATTEEFAGLHSEYTKK